MVESADPSSVRRGDHRGRQAGGVVRGPDHRRVVRAEALAIADYGFERPAYPIRNPKSAIRNDMYTELHCHSAFSFLDGASLPEQLALTASQLGYPALALTYHNGLYGSMAFAQESKQLGLQAITGAETTEGYANLCRLITEAHLGREDRRDPRLAFASLEARHAGLIVLSG